MAEAGVDPVLEPHESEPGGLTLNQYQPGRLSGSLGGWQRWLVWCLGLGVIALILSILVVDASVTIRKLGLFSVLVGGLSGGAVGWWGRDCAVGPRRLHQILAPLVSLCLLLMAAQNGFARLKNTAAAQKNASAMMALRILENMEGKGQELQEMRRRLEPTFSDYLAFRVSTLGDWSTPWPELFWGVELLLSMAVAGAVSTAALGSRATSATTIQ